MKIDSLKQYVETAAAIRYRARLQPAGGPGDKVFPPTYEGGRYAEEMRRIDGDLVPCVQLDSVQSQANRMEESLLQAVRAERIALPLVEVDFRAKAEQMQAEKVTDSEEWMVLEDLKAVGVITSLDAPHRLADAIIRDSVAADGKKFRDTDEGKLLNSAAMNNAAGLFGIAPTSLLFGLWDSTGPRGGLGVKFQRAIVSELVAMNAAKGVKSASRIDPTGIVRDKEGSGALSTTIYKTASAHRATCGDWTPDAEHAESKGGKPLLYGKEGKPSEANLGNVTPDLKNKDGHAYHGGVTFDYALQTTVLSLAALRKLHFPVDGRADTDTAAQTVLAALGLAAAVLTNAKGVSLRSRCDLVPEPDGAAWEVVKADGTTETFTLTPAEACSLLNDAVGVAKAAGLPWCDEPLVLLPSEGLAELVKRSRQLTSQKKGE